MRNLQRTSNENRVGDLFSSFFNQLQDDPFWKQPSGQSGFQAPSLDLSESDEDYLIEIEAAGLDPEEMDITLSGNTLTVKGEKVQEETDRDYHRTERRYGAFTRQVHLPDAVNEEDIEAEYERGLVRIWVPKAQEAQQKQIEVNVKK